MTEEERRVIYLDEQRRIAEARREAAAKLVAPRANFLALLSRTVARARGEITRAIR